jgi:hypothetical protein
MEVCSLRIGPPIPRDLLRSPSLTLLEREIHREISLGQFSRRTHT